ncbi:hypothetical protein SAMN02745134_00251 [Clostridium acidisoli DSM 12555]|uniref:Uncharacterized protein n=1 Tax=Clostridium acidisoli DSM 12555 TaxID=1121291 RepID=A0A1W1WZP8_9CLOT|nr:hypothetical protein [Clostridium acidisoli]SMC17189.1 hypothetical protein SAMN02745134_00251 [Clostridium acidisoli DSM 12555]
MSKILDLSIYEEDTLDIKTPKGNTIRVKKPTEEISIKLISYQSKAQKITESDLADETNIINLMNMLKDLTKSILSNNKDQIEINDEYLKENDINYSMELAIMGAYTEFMSEVVSDPNSKSPQTRTIKKKVGK